MAKKFGGFTDQQNEVLARKMGFKGPMDQFGSFLQSDPSKQEKFASYEQKAQKLLQGGAPIQKPKAQFAAGGWIALKEAQEAKNPTPSSTTTTGTTTGTTTTSAGQQLTNTAINDPSSLVTQTEVTPLETSADQFVDPSVGQVTPSEDVQATTVGQTQQAEASPTTAAPQVDTVTTAEGVQSAADNMQAAQGTVSSGATVEAAQALPSANATVQGQLENLMAQFEGGETPAWAAGALRNANAIMAQRGLGSSSMAASAATQAAMESAIQIAVQDASTFSQFEMQNLNNRQQARLVNAQSFLQMDLANLNNRQQTEMFKSQSIIQSLFTDAAAENASAQFNATSQAQTDQFFASLNTQVSQFNAAQTNAMEQFNAGQTNSVAMFNRQMNDAADQFNANNRLVVDQSNAEWRRAVSTANNASINEANRINAQAATGMTLAGYNNMMQRERDLYSFAYQSAENAAQRAHDLTLARYNQRASRSSAVGAAVGALGSAAIQSYFS